MVVCSVGPDFSRTVVSIEACCDVVISAVQRDVFRMRRERKKKEKEKKTHNPLQKMIRFCCIFSKIGNTLGPCVEFLGPPGRFVRAARNRTSYTRHIQRKLPSG